MSEQELKGIKRYRSILKERGFRGLIQQEGWKVAVLLFLFFLGKGLVWLVIFFGGYEAIKEIFS
ncbi:MAG: hypothetical protein LPK80_02530 [Bacteroidota bacterium]|nr:hypothetical protein [Bacteroidota bacterium]MDX5429295.1 hypothetical protein [Bacteroidota bacterium]MDX5506912.1 hypothetical protein [Bacteroidota bacterium]